MTTRRISGEALAVWLVMAACLLGLLAAALTGQDRVCGHLSGQPAAAARAGCPR